MYAKGMTTRQISDTIEDIYGFDVSEGFISDVTDKILPQIENWQNRPLDEVYPVIYINAIHYSVRDNGVIVKKAAYVILEITCEGHKEVLSLAIGENESAKFWLNSLNELKNRGRVRVAEKWSAKYPNSMKRWVENWDVVVPIFKFSKDVRKIIYTTHAIESLNSCYRKLNRQRSVFPGDQALLKALYLATFEATKNGLSLSTDGGRHLVKCA